MILKIKNKKYLFLLLVLYIIVFGIGCSKSQDNISSAKQKTNNSTLNSTVNFDNQADNNGNKDNTINSSNQADNNGNKDNTIINEVKEGTNNNKPVENTNNVKNNDDKKDNEKSNDNKNSASSSKKIQASNNTQQTNANVPSSKTVSSQINSSSSSPSQPHTSSKVSQIQTFTGFLQDEDCFVQYVDPKTGAAKEDPGNDNKTCLLMNSCAGSGYGITVKQANGTYKYYYFDGNFATGKGKSFIAGTGAQKTAWDICNNTKKQDHVTVTVTGTLDGSSRTNTNVTFPENQDGINYPVITVKSIIEN